MQELFFEAYVSVAGARQGPGVWLNTNQELWTLVLPQGPTSKILQLPPEDSWASVAQELQQVFQSSLLGTRLFGFAKEAAYELAEKVITKHLDKLLKLDSIIADSVAKVRSEAMDDLIALPGSEYVQEKQYRGWRIVGKATCAAKQLDFGIQACLRGYACAAGDLPALPAEQLLCKQPCKTSQGKVAEALLRDAVAARKFALSITQADACLNGEATQDNRADKGGSSK